MADQRGEFHMSHDASLRMWPPQFKMDAIKETAWQAAKFENQKLLYLYCIDFSYLFDLTIPSLPFLKLNCVFGHIHPDEVEDNDEVILIWDFQILETNLSITSASSLVRPKVPSLSDKMPLMPLLNLTASDCNCTNVHRGHCMCF
ncbi:hypothetical protein OS493_034384 [Desmophyllum pertusum]|uniref:Uncharacterized protein n=1 Tax=Desmophyllum pertusum TaxID=174260 RepID=A0A9X0D6V9_9CNID|nr:hypothetical protein OS493_034384 [Desmophyllum pertusum]